MAEYRAKLAPGNQKPPSSKLGKSRDGFINLGLPSHLAMARGKSSLAWPNIPVEAPTVDEEYHRYAYVPRSPHDVNILRFWEV